MRYFLAQTFGLDTHANNTTRKLCSLCGKEQAMQSDQFHHTSCKHGGNQQLILFRHDYTKRIFAKHLKQFGIVFEETYDWVDSQKRADVQFTTDKESFLIDIQHTNPSGLDFQNSQGKTASILFAAKCRERDKEKKYAEDPQHNPKAIFIPAIFEATGGFGEKMQEFIKTITTIAITSVGPSFAHELIQDFINDLACTIVKCNTTMYQYNVSRIDLAVAKGTFEERHC